MIFRLIFIVVLFVSPCCKALDKGPEIVRICLDNNTSIATVYWKSTSDACSSFKSYIIYTSENSGPWIKASVVTVFLSNSCGVLLGDLSSDWKFKITTHSACNGIDSFESSAQSIDQSKPSLIELDSVSFDLATQKLNAGWNKNTALDTKGYRLYNFANSIFSLITDTASTYIIFNKLDNKKPQKIALATFDSCDQFAPISQTHQPVYLTANLDSCAKSISLNWSIYEGWSAINQYLILNKNNTAFAKIAILPSTASSYFLNNISLGDNLCYYIRTENINNNYTSSSNTVCFKTPRPLVPKFNYINNVTVVNNNSIAINYSTDGLANTDSLLVEKSTDGLSFSPFIKFKLTPTNTTGQLLDALVNVNTNIYTYRITAISQCLKTITLSNLGKSILLLNTPISNNINELNWNLYSQWEKGIDHQSIETSNDGFTWNPFKVIPNNLKKHIVGEDIIIEDSICFRVTNTENLNSQNLSAVSVSNIKCLYPVSDFYLPGSINPYSHNNTFCLYGKGVNQTKGLMEIYNRWGEKIFETDNLQKGWDGRVNEATVLQGYYLYKVTFSDLNNNRHFKKGTLFIIR